MRSTLLFIAVTLALATRSLSQDTVENPALDPSAKVETCTVHGTVYAAASGAPLKSATVILKTGSNAFHQLTDLQGHFIFTGLPAGSYEVHAIKAGYVREGYRLENGNTNETLELRPGDKLGKVQFRLTQAGIIMGRVTDENGEPVAGAEMDALVPGLFKQDVVMYKDAGRFAMTNDLGEYRLYGLPPGAYYLAANVAHDGELMNSLGFMGMKKSPILYYPGVTSRSEASRIRIKAGQEIHVDFPLRMPKLFTLSGRVLDPGGRPEAKALIRIRPQEHDFGLLIPSTNHTETDAQGNFVLSEIVSGAYVVSAVNDPTVSEIPDSTDGKVWPPNIEQYWTEQGVEVAEGNISGLQLQLKEKLKIKGKVTFAGGPNLDLVGLTVFLNGEHDFEPEERPSVGWIEKNGDFMIEDVRPARNRLSMSGLPDGYYLRSASFVSQNVLQEGLDLSGKVEAGHLLKVTVSPGAAQVQGIVLLGDAPVRGAVVRIFPETPNPYHENTSNARTGEDGRFIIKNMPPGKYLVRANASLADGDDDDASSSDSANTAKIDLTENDSKIVQLKLP
jgi:protocatechuate 3,4-dioxygenase beta subunit